MPRPTIAIWFFQYHRDDVLLADGRRLSRPTANIRGGCGTSKGPAAISRQQEAEIERDRFLLKLNGTDTPCEHIVTAAEARRGRYDPVWNAC